MKANPPSVPPYEGREDSGSLAIHIHAKKNMPQETREAIFEMCRLAKARLEALDCRAPSFAGNDVTLTYAYPVEDLHLG